MTKSPVLALFCILFLPAFSSIASTGGDPSVPLPDDGVPHYTDEISGNTILSKSAAKQRAFLARHPSWRMTLDSKTGTPHRAWGKGISIDGYPDISLLSAPSAGRRFLEEYSAVMMLEFEKLRLLYSEIVRGKVYQKYIQQVNGLDVLHSYVDLRFTKTGKVILFGSDYHPSVDVNTQPSIGVEAARAFSTAGLDQPPSASLEITGGDLLILPLRYPDRIDYRLVYHFEVPAGDDLWDTYIDAHTGDIVWRRNLLHHFGAGDGPDATTKVVNGIVRIDVYEVSHMYPDTTLPLANAYVNVNGKEYITDRNGRFSADIGNLG